jgi:hypothetical protein
VRLHNETEYLGPVCIRPTVGAHCEECEWIHAGPHHRIRHRALNHWMLEHPDYGAAIF